MGRPPLECDLPLLDESRYPSVPGKDSPDYTASVKPFDEYTQYLQTSTRIEVHSLVDQDCNSLQMEEATDQYLYYGEDTTDPSIPASIISIPQLVTDLQIASKPPEESTAPEPEIFYSPIRPR